MNLDELELFRLLLRDWAAFQENSDDEETALVPKMYALESIQDVRYSRINARLLFRCINLSQGRPRSAHPGCWPRKRQNVDGKRRHHNPQMGGT
jgi:hypothetical protein